MGICGLNKNNINRVKGTENKNINECIKIEETIKVN